MFAKEIVDWLAVSTTSLSGAVLPPPTGGSPHRIPIASAESA